jgi:hypothetical protein
MGDAAEPLAPLAHEAARDVHPLVEPAASAVHHEHGRPSSYHSHLDRSAGGGHHTASREETGSGSPHVRPIHKVGPHAGNSEREHSCRTCNLLRDAFHDASHSSEVLQQLQRRGRHVRWVL